MASVALENIAKRFGGAAVLDGVDLRIEDGEFVVFVGASGSGKSTLLRIIAGLEAASAGRVVIGGIDMTERPPAERGLSMVFQSYALYPHMTVRQNIAFGLKLAKASGETVAQRVAEAAAMLQIEPLLDRRPRQLSGGQRQRVAIARAIVRQPSTLLFDEPLSNLDAALRAQTRLEIIELHRRLGATMIYVTHDQVEAMTLADRIVVLNGGRVEQAGPPAELYHRPATLFVARFLGSPAMTLIEAGPGDGAKALLRTGETVPLPGPAPGLARLGVRSEDVEVADEGLPAQVALVEELGETRIVHARLGDKTLVALRSRTIGEADIGREIRLRLRPERLHPFDAAGRRIEPAG